MGFDQWMKDAPLELEKEVKTAQMYLGYWQDRLAILLAVQRAKTMPPQDAPTPNEFPPIRLPCFGDFEVWNPAEPKCVDCAVKSECEVEVANKQKSEK